MAKVPRLVWHYIGAGYYCCYNHPIAPTEVSWARWFWKTPYSRTYYLPPSEKVGVHTRRALNLSHRREQATRNRIWV